MTIPTSDTVVTNAVLDAALAPLRNDIGAITAFLEARLAGHGGAPGVWQWWTLRGKPREALWWALHEWVQMYNARYGYAREERTIPPCWPQHPVAVEELTAQMVAWWAAHQATTPTTALREFHEHLYPAIDRLRDPRIGGGFDRCSATVHQVENTVVPVAVPEALFARYVAVDLAATHTTEDANP
ncbi:MAG: hypothetical protein FWE61_03150 [Micrococcales bacterium]|nr:hypothetical protein [Micrococcales bacterium]